jgi:hypothetical protein
MHYDRWNIGGLTLFASLVRELASSALVTLPVAFPF